MNHLKDLVCAPRWTRGFLLLCLVLWVSFPVRTHAQAPADVPRSHANARTTNIAPIRSANASRSAVDDVAHRAQTGANALREHARLSLRQGNFELALHQLQQAAQSSHDAGLWLEIGDAADRLRLDQIALNAYREFLVHAPDANNRIEILARIDVLRRVVGSRGLVPVGEIFGVQPPAPHPPSGRGNGLTPLRDPFSNGQDSNLDVPRELLDPFASAQRSPENAHALARSLAHQLANPWQNQR